MRLPRAPSLILHSPESFRESTRACTADSVCNRVRRTSRSRTRTTVLADGSSSCARFSRERSVRTTNPFKHISAGALAAERARRRVRRECHMDISSKQLARRSINPSACRSSRKRFSSCSRIDFCCQSSCSGRGCLQPRRCRLCLLVCGDGSASRWRCSRLQAVRSRAVRIRHTPRASKERRHCSMAV